MKTALKTVANAVAARTTWANVKWFLLVNVGGWVMQGVVFGALTLADVESLHALVTAKVTNWVVFLGQCIRKARS